MTPSDESDDPREPTRRTRARLPDSRQGSLFAVRTLTPHPYEAHSFLGLLETLGEHLFDRRDFPPDQSTGTSAWCPVLMTKLILIQRKNSWSDEQTVDAARQRLDVKACLGLGIHQPGPSAAKLSRHRTMLAERGLLERYERRFLDLVKQIGLLGESEPLLVDSVPVHGAGQVLDTFNLLGAGLRRVLGALAKRQGRAVAEVARELNVQRFLDRSTKAALALDWTDAEAKLGGLSELVAAVGRVLEAADSCQNDSPGQPQSETPPGQADEPPDEPVDGDDGPGGGSCAALAAEVETLRAVVERDVEVDAEGVVVGIVERSADDRFISVTDPDMRHGRKSASALIAGFKAHLLVSVVWGWIVGVRLTAANVHDGRVLEPLLRDAWDRELWPEWVGGDHAYGTLANHAWSGRLATGAAAGDAEARKRAFDLIARMARPSERGRLPKDAFAIDFERAELTCPEGHVLRRTRYASQRGEKGWLFEFGHARCGPCPLRAQCVSGQAGDTTGRSVFVVPAKERLIRAHLERRGEEEFRDKLAKRVGVEHANARFKQCGGKDAKRFGLPKVAFDARVSALACNLRRLAGIVANNPRLLERLRAFAARLRRRAEARHLLLWARIAAVYLHTARWRRSDFGLSGRNR